MALGEAMQTPPDRDPVAAIHLPAGGGPPTVARARWFDDWADRLLFLLFFLGGFGAVLVLKLLADQTLLAALAAGALLLAYAGLAWKFSAQHTRADRLGDNCYYLGLLYTLASLAAALIQLEWVATREEHAALVETLLASFGVALISTIMGIALRVFFLQMRREVDDLEEHLRHDLQARATAMKNQLLLAVEALEGFRLRTQQVLEERLNQATGAYAANAEAQTRAVSDLAARVMAEMEGAFSRHAANAKALDESTRQLMAAGADLAGRMRAIDLPRDLLTRRAEAMAQRLGRASEHVEESTAALARRIDAIEVPTDLVSARLAPALIGLDQAARQASAALGTAGQTAASGGAALRAAADELAAGLASLNEMLPAAAGLERAVPAIAESADQLRQALDTQAAAIRAIAAASAEDAKAVRAHRDQLLANLAESRAALGRTQATLTEIVNLIVERLGG